MSEIIPLADVGSNTVVTKNLETTVVALRNRPLSTNAPTAGQALVFDGTNWTPTTPAAVPTIPPNVDKVPALFFFGGKPSTTGPRIGMSIALPLHIPTDFAGSGFYAAIAPTGTPQFNCWTTIAGATTSTGYIRVNPDGSITGLMTAVTLNPGDKLAFAPPATQDATLSDVSLTVLMTRA